MLSAVRIAEARTGGRAAHAKGAFAQDAFVTVELPVAEDWYQPAHDWYREDDHPLAAGQRLPYGPLLHFAWLQPSEPDDDPAAADEVNRELIRRLGDD